MLAFERMLVYYDDGNYRVKWDGQEGGIEGRYIERYVDKSLLIENSF